MRLVSDGCQCRELPSNALCLQDTTLGNYQLPLVLDWPWVPLPGVSSSMSLAGGGHSI